RSGSIPADERVLASVRRSREFGDFEGGEIQQADRGIVRVRVLVGLIGLIGDESDPATVGGPDRTPIGDLAGNRREASLLVRSRTVEQVQAPWLVRGLREIDRAMAIRGDRAVERIAVWDAGRELAHGRTRLPLAKHERGCSGPDVSVGARIDDPEMRIEHSRNGSWGWHRRRPRSGRRAGEGAVTAGEVHREALGHRGTLRQTELLDQQLVRERAIQQWAASANRQNHCLTGRDIDELVLANWPLGGLD